MILAREGRVILVGLLVVTGFTATGGWVGDLPILKIVAGMSLVLLAFSGYFFRDPRRAIPEGKNLVVAPADGRVVYAGDIIGVDGLLTQAKQVSIFLSILDVHRNRVPVSGLVTHVHYSKGRFLAAFKPDASDVNEQMEVHIQTGNSWVKVRQVAGFLARRIICYLKVGDRVTMGSRLGFIRFGSRIDLLLPTETHLHICEGDRVRGGETIIGILS